MEKNAKENRTSKVVSTHYSHCKKLCQLAFSLHALQIKYHLSNAALLVDIEGFIHRILNSVRSFMKVFYYKTVRRDEGFFVPDEFVIKSIGDFPVAFLVIWVDTHVLQKHQILVESRFNIKALKTVFP